MPLLVIVCLLLAGVLLCLPQAPLMDNHPEWQSVWDKTHLANSRNSPWAYLIDLAMVLTVPAFAFMVRLCMRKTDAETLIMGLFACLLIYHLGWKVIPYYGNGLHNAAMPIDSGFYDPKALPPMNGILGYIWGLGLFFTEIMMLLLLPILLIYKLNKKSPGIFVLATLQLCTAHALLQTLTPDFWLWFMD
jgi:hypothetical protein